ncbi:hypothetical protein WMY93_031196 [Mugilogobius chulae]|uniref:Transmembrane 131 like n=1 Tax=Mugilogobius chulae TaxID=88201 RepID=A0AAW0MEN8_9GOBI
MGCCHTRYLSIKLTQTQEDASNITILGLLLECSMPKSLFSSPEGSCLQSEERLSLQINLSARGDRPADLDKLKPYVIEHILVLLVAHGTGLLSTAEPKLGVYMLNSGSKKLDVKEMQVLSKLEANLAVHQALLRPEAKNFTQVATLSCRGSMPGHGRKCISHISLDIVGNQSLDQLPGLHITHRRSTEEVFQVKQTHSEQVELWISNPLSVALTVTNASLSHRFNSALKVVNFSRPVTVAPGCFHVLSLQLLHRSPPLNQVFTLSLNTSLDPRCMSLSTFTLLSPSRAVCCLVWSESAVGLVLSDCLRQVTHHSCRSEWQRSLLPDFFPSSWAIDSKLASELCSRWQRHRDKPPCRWPRLPVETSSTLDFGATPVNESKVKTFVLKNPSSSVVAVEIRILSLYPAPLEALDLLTKWNNLTVFDMVTVRGHGAKELIRVGSKLPGPGASLRFNVPQSLLMECRDGLRNNKPLFAIKKSFKVENAGELPLTVMSMNINGYKCQGFGFEVLQCHSFHLDHNSSLEITIVFIPDFTSSWVIRDLTLVTARGTSFPFTLNVTLPHHMLPLCAQVMPGPSWEENFWLLTVIFTCFSLFFVCWMAFDEAHYILNDFTTPSIRSNHNSNLPRDNGTVNNITPNGVNKSKGSCKSYVDSCHPSDKGKGRGSPALANSPPQRAQSSKKNSSSTPTQTQKKPKVSLYYSKYKYSPAPAVAVEEESEDTEELLPDTPSNPEPDAMEPAFLSEMESKAEYAEASAEEVPAVVMFPMEMPAGFPDNMTVSPGPRPGLLMCTPSVQSFTQPYDKVEAVKRDSSEQELRGDGKSQKKKVQSAESGTAPGNKGKRSRKKSENGLSAPEHSLTTAQREKEPEWKNGNHNNAARSRNRNGCKTEAPKTGPCAESPLKLNGSCPARSRHRGPSDRRTGPCESGSDSGSSSRSVRDSRGSWSSASSMEGDKEQSGRTHTCSTSANKRESMQYSTYPSEREYHHNSSNTKPLSMNTLYVKELCQSPEPPVPSFNPSFAAVAAGVDRNMEACGQYVPEENWSAPSIPLTNEFRYNTTEALPYLPQTAAPTTYNGFTWNSANNHCSPYTYCEENDYIGNGTFTSGFPAQDCHNAHSPQSSWTEEQPQGSPPSWDSAAACVGTKPVFSGTRSLSPMSSLFGSIWTPQSEPYQSHFHQPDRSAAAVPMSPVTPPTHLSPENPKPPAAPPTTPASTPLDPT